MEGIHRPLCKVPVTLKGFLFTRNTIIQICVVLIISWCALYCSKLIVYNTLMYCNLCFDTYVFAILIVICTTYLLIY